jgi:hypothetical protein
MTTTIRRGKLALVQPTVRVVTTDERIAQLTRERDTARTREGALRGLLASGETTHAVTLARCYDRADAGLPLHDLNDHPDHPRAA